MRTRPALHKAEAENFGLEELTSLLFVAKIYGNNFQGIGIVCNWASRRRLSTTVGKDRLPTRTIRRFLERGKTHVRWEWPINRCA